MVLKYLGFFLVTLNISLFSVNKVQLGYSIRRATVNDRVSLKELYQKVADLPGGLARDKSEITDLYIDKILLNGLNNGLLMVVESQGRLIGAMVKFRLEPAAFKHVLAEGSILVDPDFHGMGIGTRLIYEFLEEVKSYFPEILRIELVVRESNPAIRLYERMGFKKEGRFEMRIRSSSGQLEADIPMAWLRPEVSR
jgi:putative acetyltransferase